MVLRPCLYTTNVYKILYLVTSDSDKTCSHAKLIFIYSVLNSVNVASTNTVFFSDICCVVN